MYSAKVSFINKLFLIIKIILIFVCRPKGVCIQNGLLLSFYDKGILCWKVETGELVEEIYMDSDVLICGNYVMFMEGNKFVVRHSISHLLSMSVEES